MSCYGGFGYGYGCYPYRPVCAPSWPCGGWGSYGGWNNCGWNNCGWGGPWC